MTRVFLDDGQIHGNHAVVHGSDAHHLLNVLRMARGDTFTVVDQRGAERVATIEETSEGEVRALLGPARQPETEAEVEVTLYHGLPRASRYETALRMCTELGVQAFVPVLSERSVVRLDPRGRAKKQDRWQRIVEEAARQCGRTRVPEVAMPMPWREALARYEASGDPGVMPSAGLAGSDAVSLGEHLATLAADGVERLALFVGPESGFDLSEESEAREAGIALVTMGPRILRTETATVVAAAICLDRLGEMR